MTSELVRREAQTLELCPDSWAKHMIVHSPNERYAWSVQEWARAIGLSRAYVYVLLDEKRIRSVKCGSRRLITTPPAEFLEQLAEAAAS